MKTRFIPLLLGCLCCALPSMALAQSLGLNFAATDPDAATSSLEPSEVAGVVPQDNWNNLADASGSATNLVDDTGAATSASVEWSSNNTWRSGGRNEGTGGDAKLMSGYLDYLDDPLTVPEITVSGLDDALGGPAYNVYVYVQGDSDQVRGGEWTVNDVTQELVDSDTFATFAEGENFLRFAGITGDAINISSLAVDLGGGETLRAPINGVQIVVVPEPASALLASLSVVGMGVVIRRRRTR